MRISLLASTHTDYRALRAKKRSLALIWELGRACFAFSLLSAFCGIEVFVVNSFQTELTAKRDRSFVVTFAMIAIFFVVIGFALKRYAVKKGERIGEQIVSSV